MTGTQRVMSVVEGRRGDRPPYCFWQHFGANEVHGEGAVRAHLRHFRAYQLDFMKVMNDNPYPHGTRVKEGKDLVGVKELRGDEEGFGRQLELIARLRAELGRDVLMVTTIFNAWTVLRHLIEPPVEHNPPEMEGAGDGPSRRIKEMHEREPLMVAEALRRIGVSLTRFAKRCLEAGANGIFLSVRDDWVRAEGDAVDLYAALVRATDLQIIREGAAGGRMNVLHVCGKAVDFRSFGEYPVQVINWADRVAGPSIADAKTWLRPAICGGVDNLKTLRLGSAEDVEREVREALEEAELRPMIVAPGCTYDPHGVPPANLEAIGRGARQWRYPG